jgi:ubiquinone/menaquinone biosynthesis C-methylase UbiE
MPAREITKRGASALITVMPPRITAKSLAPYRQWLDALTDAGDRVLVPCAGTAPTAIAAELVHGDRANVLAIDIEPDARAAYERRRRDELDRQTALSNWGTA